jgi:hypothetical protein
MYFLFFSGGRDLDSFIILGFSYVPMWHSSTSLPLASIFGFLATSLKSNKSSNGTKPLGNTLFFNCKILESTSFSLNSFASILHLFYLHYHSQKQIYLQIHHHFLNLCLYIRNHSYIVENLRYDHHFQIPANI